MQFHSIPFNAIHFNSNSIQFNSIKNQFSSIQLNSIPFDSLHFSSITFNRRLGGREGCQGLSPTGKSFRFVRACARCPLPSGNEPQIGSSMFSLFPFRRGRLSLFRFWGWPFPFPLRSKVNPPPLPPTFYLALAGLMDRRSIQFNSIQFNSIQVEAYGSRLKA